LEKLLPFVRLLLAIILLPLPLFAAEDIPVRTPESLSPELIEEVQETVKGFQAPAQEKEFNRIVELAHMATTTQKTEDILKIVYPDINTSTINKAASSCSDNHHFKELYYFFSFSMPQQTLKNAVREILRINKESQRKVTMVLRGFVNNDFKATVKAFYGLMDDHSAAEDLPVEIDPVVFDKYAIEVVPTVLRISGDKTGIVTGETALKFALAKFDEELKDHGKYGNTYPIAEENFFDLIKRKQPAIEAKVKSRISEIKDKMYVLTKFNGQFEKVKEERVYYIDPSVVLAEDIKDHAGNILFRKGTRYNPADYIQLGSYIIIDGRDQEQVKFALGKDFKKIILIAGNLSSLTGKYHHQFFFGNENIIERFQIKRVPAVVEQEGEYIRVTEKLL
jgi:conjugal transfer pilus assembly protein TraW